MPRGLSQPKSSSDSTNSTSVSSPTMELDKISWLFNKGPQPPNCVATGWREKGGCRCGTARRGTSAAHTRPGLSRVLELAGKVDNPRTVGFSRSEEFRQRSSTTSRSARKH